MRTKAALTNPPGFVGNTGSGVPMNRADVRSASPVPGVAASATKVVEAQPYPPELGQPWARMYQTAEVSTAETRSVNSRPPATGRNHPGARRDRTATTLTTAVPRTAQP